MRRSSDRPCRGARRGTSRRRAQGRRSPGLGRIAPPASVGHEAVPELQSGSSFEIEPGDTGVAHDPVRRQLDHGLLRERQLARGEEHLVEARVRSGEVVHAIREHHELGVAEEFDESISIGLRRSAHLQALGPHHGSSVIDTSRVRTWAFFFFHPTKLPPNCWISKPPVASGDGVSD